MKIYISGRIKGYDGYEAHFARESHKLRLRDGFEVVNPCDLDPGGEDPTYEDFMRCDIKALLDCDTIYMLDGWERNVGARCEHLVAIMCGMTINYEGQKTL